MPEPSQNLGLVLAINGPDLPKPNHISWLAIRLKPADPLAHKRFADALNHQGRFHEAIGHLQVAQCLSAKPDMQTRLDLAALLYQTGDSSAAADQFRKVLSLNPDLPEPLNNLAWLLATCSDDRVRNGAEAVRHAEHGCQVTAFKQTGMISTLAAAYAEAGRYPERRSRMLKWLCGCKPPTARPILRTSITNSCCFIAPVCPTTKGRRETRDL